MTVSIVIPVFNEQQTVATLLRKVLRVKLPAGFSKEVIVVNDGSTDASQKEIKPFKSQIRYFAHITNRGKGAAVRTGIDHSNGEVVIIQDADLEYNPSDYSRLLAPFKDRLVQAVFGSRLIDYPLNLWGKSKTPFPLHYLANHFLTNLTNVLYGSSLTDMETCYKAVRAKLLKSLQLQSNAFDIEAEITAKVLKRGIKIVEVPIQVTPRGYDEGKKIGWRDGLIAIWTLLKYRLY